MASLLSRLVLTATLPVVAGMAGAPGLALSELEGSGKAASAPRVLPPFTRIQVAGAVDVAARVGGARTVVVEGDDNLLGVVETVVQGDALVVSAKQPYSTRLGLRVKITAPELEAVTVHGSADAFVEGLKGPAFAVAVRGSGDIDVRGTADRVTIEVLGSGSVSVGELAAQRVEIDVRGSGDVSARGVASELAIRIHGSGDGNCADLKAKTVEAYVFGSGDVLVHASESLTARVLGSGDIVYGGDPAQTDVKSRGSGNVIKR